MAIKGIWCKLTGWAQKHKYPFLVVLIGLLLMLWPSTNNSDGSSISITQTDVVQEASLEERLGELLSKVSGAGEVSVILTESLGAEVVYQEDTDEAKDENDTSIRKETIVLTDENRSQYGLVKQTNPPRYQGAIVLCQGADSPTIRLAMVEAVSKVTGLGADRITVLKMK